MLRLMLKLLCWAIGHRRDAWMPILSTGVEWRHCGRCGAWRLALAPADGSALGDSAVSANGPATAATFYARGSGVLMVGW